MIKGSFSTIYVTALTSSLLKRSTEGGGLATSSLTSSLLSKPSTDLGQLSAKRTRSEVSSSASSQTSYKSGLLESNRLTAIPLKLSGGGLLTCGSTLSSKAPPTSSTLNDANLKTSSGLLSTGFSAGLKSDRLRNSGTLLSKEEKIKPKREKLGVERKGGKGKF